MTRPWFGILPPPRGQGYYPGEGGEFFAPKPGSTINRLQFEERDTFDIAPLIEEQVREIRQRIDAIVEAEALRALVSHLRGLGYTVIAPNLTPTLIDTSPIEILGENGEIIGIFDPTQQF